MKMFLKIAFYILCGVVGLVVIGSGIFGYKLYTQLRDGGKIVEWNDSEGTTYRDLRYGDGARNTYNLVIPTDKQPDALMLFIHGGSWTSGEKEDMEYEVHRYAKMGYATATMNYSRLGQDTLDVSMPYNSPSFESMVKEIYACVDAIKAKGKELGCDFRQMAVGGYSAGGHLAMLYATRHATTSPIPVKFQISWVGPADLDLLFPMDTVLVDKILSGEQSEDIQKQRQELKHFLQSITGEIITDDALSVEAIKNIRQTGSPLHYVSTTTPPAVLAYGGKDMLVLSEHGKRMADAMQSKGVDHSLIIFPNSGHTLDHDKEYTQMVIDEIRRFCKTYFD